MLKVVKFHLISSRSLLKIRFPENTGRFSVQIHFKKRMGYIFEAATWTFKNTNISLHRLTKIEGEDSLSIDLLEGNEERHKEIIKNAVIDDN
jgi:hypothetical protein